MKVEDFSFQRDDSGVEFVTFSEGLTKTRGGGLRVEPQLATPKMFATGTKRCPVALLKKYLDKRPAELKMTGPAQCTSVLSTSHRPACGSKNAHG